MIGCARYTPEFIWLSSSPLQSFYYHYIASYTSRSESPWNKEKCIKLWKINITDEVRLLLLFLHSYVCCVMLMELGQLSTHCSNFSAMRQLINGINVNWIKPSNQWAGFVVFIQFCEFSFFTLTYCYCCCYFSRKVFPSTRCYSNWKWEDNNKLTF